MVVQQLKKLGARIVYYRKIQSVTQEKFAHAVGISLQYLSRIENGNYPKSVSLPTLMKIAGELGITTSQLLADIEKEIE